jgi:hypothetical protein
LAFLAHWQKLEKFLKERLSKKKPFNAVRKPPYVIEGLFGFLHDFAKIQLDFLHSVYMREKYAK